MSAGGPRQLRAAPRLAPSRLCSASAAGRGQRQPGERDAGGLPLGSSASPCPRGRPPAVPVTSCGRTVPAPSREGEAGGAGVLDGTQGIRFLFSGKVNLKDARIPGKQSDKTLRVPLPHLVARTGECHARLPHQRQFPAPCQPWGPGAVWADVDENYLCFLSIRGGFLALRRSQP